MAEDRLVLHSPIVESEAFERAPRRAVWISSPRCRSRGLLTAAGHEIAHPMSHLPQTMRFWQNWGDAQGGRCN
jgi:hypothetical protein